MKVKKIILKSGNHIKKSNGSILCELHTKKFRLAKLVK